MELHTYSWRCTTRYATQRNTTERNTTQRNITQHPFLQMLWLRLIREASRAEHLKEQEDRFHQLEDELQRSKDGG